MVSAETSFNCLDWKIHFTLHTDASDKQLSAVISHNIKPIAFFSILLINPQREYTATEKDIILIVQ